MLLALTRSFIYIPPQSPGVSRRSAASDSIRLGQDGLPKTTKLTIVDASHRDVVASCEGQNAWE